jgi:hypothetical protein
MHPDDPPDDGPTPPDEDEFFIFVAKRQKEIVAERLRELQARELAE